jgi:hypothetical protein
MGKELIEVASKVAGRKAGECPCDNGKLRHVHPLAHSEDVIVSDCPTCSRLREIAKWCWHEAHTQDPKYSYPIHGYKCKHCGEIINISNYGTNPTLDIPALRQLLEDLGEYNNFLDDLVASVWNALCECIDIEEGADDDIWVYIQVFRILARILQSVPLMSEAVQSYLTNLLEG